MKVDRNSTELPVTTPFFNQSLFYERIYLNINIFLLRENELMFEKIRKLSFVVYFRHFTREVYFKSLC